MRRKIVAALSLLLCWLIFFNLISFTAAAESREIINDWCLDLINLQTDKTAGTSPVKIAVIDSGVRRDNAHIQDKIAPGYNYVFNNTNTHDLIGHGSQTAAIIVGGNFGKHELIGIGSRAATIVPLVWITKYPSGVPVNGGVPALCKAIIDAVDVYGCQIINISSGISSDDPALRKAVAYAEERGVLVISAVGNCNQYAPEKIFYPAAYDTVIGVGSVNKDKQVSEFSQRNTSVMVTAPGEKVYSMSGHSSKDFVQISGTSYATAYVSGFASFLLSKNPEMTPAEFRQILQESSRDLGEAGYDTAYGYGLLDVARGLLLCEENKAQKTVK